MENIIKNNQAFPGGGGICVFGSGTTTIINRNLIINNESVMYLGESGALSDLGVGFRLQHYSPSLIQMPERL